jgi:hypothetical protein
MVSLLLCTDGEDCREVQHDRRRPLPEHGAQAREPPRPRSRTHHQEKRQVLFIAMSSLNLGLKWTES